MYDNLYFYCQPCSWWMQSMRCTCGLAGGLQVTKTQNPELLRRARQRRAGVTTDASQWSPSSLTQTVIIIVVIFIENSNVTNWLQEGARMKRSNLILNNTKLTNFESVMKIINMTVDRPQGLRF